MVPIAETVLLICYSLLGAYVLLQIFVLLRGKHKPFSYKAVFNFFALAWLTCRALFWALMTREDFRDSSSVFWFILYWLPHSIIYMSFATLALFLTKVIKRRTWTQRYRSRFLWAYTAFGAVDVIGTLTLAVLAGTAPDDDDSAAQAPMDAEQAGSAVLFLLLSVVYVILGCRLRRLGKWEYHRMFVFQPRTISTVTFLLATVFATRCIFNFLTLAGVISVAVGSGDTKNDIVIIVAYGVWEFFPLILLLTTVASGPITTSSYQQVPKETLNFGVFGAIDAMEAEQEAEVVVTGGSSNNNNLGGEGGLSNSNNLSGKGGLAGAEFYNNAADGDDDDGMMNGSAANALLLGGSGGAGGGGAGGGSNQWQEGGGPMGAMGMGMGVMDGVNVAGGGNAGSSGGGAGIDGFGPLPDYAGANSSALPGAFGGNLHHHHHHHHAAASGGIGMALAASTSRSHSYGGPNNPNPHSLGPSSFGVGGGALESHHLFPSSVSNTSGSINNNGPHGPGVGGFRNSLGGGLGGFGSPGGLIGGGPASFGAGGGLGGGGLGRPGGTVISSHSSFHRMSSIDADHQQQQQYGGEHAPGSLTARNNTSAAAVSLGASGFLAAQQNARLRSSYVAPSFVPAPPHLPSSFGAGGRSISGGAGVPAPAMMGMGVGMGMGMGGQGQGGQQFLAPMTPERPGEVEDDDGGSNEGGGQSSEPLVTQGTPVGGFLR